MVYVVTGCSTGLGFEICRQLLARGNSVIGIGRRADPMVELGSRSGFSFQLADLAKPDQVNALFVNGFAKDLQNINLILNAGIFADESGEQMDINDANTLFQINYFSNVELVHRFMKFNLNRILFVNSVAGLKSFGSQSQYCASKHALDSFAKSIAIRSKGLDFDVMSINPGGMNTELWQKTEMLSKTVTQEFLDPSGVAALVLALLDLPKNTYVENLTVLPEHDV